MAAGQGLCAANAAATNGPLANGAPAAERADSWDYGPIDMPRLTERVRFYMQQAGASPDVACEPCKAPCADCLSCILFCKLCGCSTRNQSTLVHLGAQARSTSCCKALWESA